MDDFTKTLDRPALIALVQSLEIALAAKSRRLDLILSGVRELAKSLTVLDEIGRME